MNDQLTEIACVIDRSGSMQSMADDAIGGFNAFLQTQRQQPGQARLTLVLFDHEYLKPYEDLDVRDIPPLTSETYVPRGNTALLDAIGRTIDDLGQRLAATPEAERPGQVIVAILTDGYENASTHYSQRKIAAMIDHQRQKYGWEFTFLAADEAAIATAEQINIPAPDIACFLRTPAGIREGMATMADEVAKKRGMAQNLRGKKPHQTD